MDWDTGFTIMTRKFSLPCALLIVGCQQVAGPNQTWVEGTIHARLHQPYTIKISPEPAPLRLVRRVPEMEKCRRQTADKYAKQILLSRDIIIDPGKGISGQFQGKIDYRKGEFILTCARNLDGYQIDH